MKSISRASIACALLLVVAMIVGTTNDRSPERPAVERAGLRVLEADLHAHTRFSDGFLSPFDLVLHAQRRGLDAVAVTEHNTVFPSKMARWFSRTIGGPTVLVAEEVTTARYHIIGLGLGQRVAPQDTAKEVIEDIHAQGGLAIAAHPVSRFWPALVPVRDLLDGAEVMHPIAYGGRSADWRWSQMREFYVQASRPLTAVSSSDYHGFAPLGLCRTLVFATGNDETAVLAALRRGRTVVYDLDGRAYGDPALVDALVREPYAVRPQAPWYAARGPLDAIARALGLLGALGLILFRRFFSASRA